MGAWRSPSTEGARGTAGSSCNPQSVIDGPAAHRQSARHAVYARHYERAAAPFGANSARGALSHHFTLRVYLLSDALGTLDLDDHLGFPINPNYLVCLNDYFVAHDLVIAG